MLSKQTNTSEMILIKNLFRSNQRFTHIERCQKSLWYVPQNMDRPANWCTRSIGMALFNDINFLLVAVRNVYSL